MKHYLQLIASVALAATSLPAANATVTLSDVTGGETIYGYMISTETGKRIGTWNQFAEDGSFTEVWKDTETDYLMMTGWMRGGMLNEIGVKTNTSGTTRSGFSYIKRNVETGAIVKETRYSTTQYRQCNFSSATFCNSSEPGIYGYVMDPEFDSYPVWKKAPANGDLTKVENIKVLEDPYSWCPSVCYNEKDGYFYGVSYRGNVVKIDMNGEMETLFELEDAVKGDQSALTYFPNTGKLLWSGRLKDGTSALYCIDPAKSTCDKVLDLKAKETFMSFIPTSDMKLESTPAPATDLKPVFNNGSSDGSAVFTMPSTFINGQDLNPETELTYNLLIDDSILLTGKGKPGAEVTVEIKGLEQGEHIFYLSVIYENIESSDISTTAYVGNDTPVATSKVNLTAEDYTLSASWEAVTEGVHGGWVDTAVMTYDIYLNSEYMESTSALNWEYCLEEGSPIAGYIVSIVAKCNGLESAARNSKAVACGAPLDLDVYIAPTAEQSALMTYISDGEACWKFNDSYEPPVFSSGAHYTNNTPLDTWLIMPPINFPKAGEYTLEFKTAVLTDYKVEDYFTVYIGKDKTAEAMTTQIVDEVNPTIAHPDYDEITENFTIDEPGIYYIGFHCTSQPKQNGALLWDINVMTGSGVSTVANSAELAYGIKGQIVADGNEGDCVNVYATDGQRVATGVIEGGALTLSVNPGIYMVSVNDKSFKILVK